MAASEVPVDLFNPGQVFACLGLIEAIEVLLGDARGAFDWSDEAAPVFRIEASGHEDPVERVLCFLRDAQLTPVRPCGWVPPTKKGKDGKPKPPPEWTKSWGAPPVDGDPEDAFPAPIPESYASLPARLREGRDTLVISHWAEASTPDRLSSGRDNVKFWAGAAGYPGTGLFRDAVDAASLSDDLPVADPFSRSAPMTSTFRFDWRGSNIPLSVGFSTNQHGKITQAAFPVVEMLAAIGLSHARPKREKKLLYHYGVIAPGPAGNLHRPAMLRAALGTAPLPFPQRMFHMHLDWPGQENQARAITHVTEESTP